MRYITIAEAARKWDVSLRQAQRLVAENRIPNAQRFGRAWMIPSDMEKPADRRRNKFAIKSFSYDLSDLSYVHAKTTIPFPDNNPDDVLNTIKEDRIRLIYEAELSYLRGGLQRVLQCFHETKGDVAARLRISPMAIAASISLGDNSSYNEIESWLKKCMVDYKGSAAAAIADLSLATAAVSMIAPNMTPEWLKNGDFSHLLPSVRYIALYLRAKYFQCTRQYDLMLAVAQSALAFSSTEVGITITDIYLRMICAVELYILGQKDEARRWLSDTMRMAIPHGFITPFAELVNAFGGLMEQCLKQEFPDHYNTIIEKWKSTWKNWIIFHNRFTKDNITFILSLREYHIAVLAANRVPYSEIAKQYDISVGRLKNIMLEIYEKLFISGRDEFAKYVL
jgi:DNA-binding CsgD family transcriptional regulator